MINPSRSSPCFSYCKQQSWAWRPGNEANITHEAVRTHTWWQCINGEQTNLIPRYPYGLAACAQSPRCVLHSPSFNFAWQACSQVGEDLTGWDLICIVVAVQIYACMCMQKCRWDRSPFDSQVHYIPPCLQCVGRVSSLSLVSILWLLALKRQCTYFIHQTPQVLHVHVIIIVSSWDLCGYYFNSATITLTVTHSVFPTTVYREYVEVAD